MEIPSSKRFIIKREDGVTTVRDRTAPYHIHTVDGDKIPSTDQMAEMTEDQYNDVVSGLIYNTGDQT